ncbi:MAG TPA: threonine--tRNA ligase [Clostridiaceae bacterium]|nr:threonine--tRNA ligase [Clostridiaceae bacterium]
MFNVSIRNGESREFSEPLSAYDALRALLPDGTADILAVEVNGVPSDLRTELRDDAVLQPLTFEDDYGRHAFFHTSSHVMAEAIMSLWPETKFAIGPAIDQGFYYDIDLDHALSEEDLASIESRMRKLLKKRARIERFVLPREEARQLMAERAEIYKVELIDELPEGETISFYRQGEFVDLCAGPHLMNTGPIKAVKLLSVSGAYWRGSEKNKMLQRIYGVSFPSKDELEAHLAALEEARARDHNKIGRQLGYFTTTDYIGQGLPIMLPKGAKVLQILERFVEDEEERRGYFLTKTPLLAKSDLYKISGHWDHYRDGMFIIGDPEKEAEEDVFALRPMTCPFQFQAYLQKTRSYRDLPLRYNETSKLFRNEASGEMHGLIRIRQFTISEAHLITRPDQVEEEFLGAVDLANFMLDALGFLEDVTYRFSTWDPNNRDKYIGEAEEWERVQDLMKGILDKSGVPYETTPGDAAFYGPKLDIQTRNVFGKEDTLITVQIDFQLAQRFGMYYTDRDGERRHPYIIHRTSIGCYERTLALLIEKYGGAMPLWLAPVQVRVMPISERHVDQAKAVEARLRAAGLRAETDARDEKIGKKIKEGQLEKIPYVIILGDQEIAEDKYAVRTRSDGDIGKMSPEDFLARLLDEVARRVNRP